MIPVSLSDIKAQQPDSVFLRYFGLARPQLFFYLSKESLFLLFAIDKSGANSNNTDDEEWAKERAEMEALILWRLRERSEASLYEVWNDSVVAVESVMFCTQSVILC